MKVAIGSDKSGFSLKEAIKAHLVEEGYQVDDLGTTDLEDVKPYFITAPIVAEQVSKGAYEKGILICGTGAGMAIVANKYPNVYAMPCSDLYDARMCRAINDANIITMGGWKIAPEVGCEMVDIFLNTSFGDGLEEWRVAFLTGGKEKVKAVENDNFKM